MSAGTLTVGGSEYLGEGGSALFDQNGGSNNAGTSLYVGDTSAGTYSQSAGTTTVTGWLYLGHKSTGSGSYSLSNEAVLNSQDNSIGYSGTGTFTQSGGTFNRSNFITIGDQPGGSGTLTLSGGALNGNNLYVGYSAASGGTAASTGVYVQSGGVATFATLESGINTGATGNFSLSETGSLTVTGNETLAAASTSVSTFTQSGGTHIDEGALTLGYSSGATGNYSLSNGNLNVAGSEIVGDLGSGSFNQTGGTHTVSGFLEIPNLSGAPGFIPFPSGASLSVGGSEYVGHQGAGTYTQSGGTATIGTDSGAASLIIGGGTNAESTSAAVWWMLTMKSLSTRGRRSQFHPPEPSSQTAVLPQLPGLHPVKLSAMWPMALLTRAEVPTG